MKALTVRQPWATLIAAGEKRLETRSRATSYSGPVAIHAALELGAAQRMLCGAEPFRSALARAGINQPEELPRGVILAVVQLVGCRRVAMSALPPEPELSFGVYSSGRWIWELRGPRRLAIPIWARGWLGFWDWEPPVGLELPGGQGGD